MKPKLAELAVLIVRRHEAFTKLQTRQLNIEISNKHQKYTEANYLTYNDLAEIETKKLPANCIYQMIVWKN